MPPSKERQFCIMLYLQKTSKDLLKESIDSMVFCRLASAREIESYCTQLSPAKATDIQISICIQRLFSRFLDLKNIKEAH